jgi:glycosyltransferase involved in cell wall biosynthesis
MHVISGLWTGGAENMLLKLLSTMDRTEFDPVVLSLRDYGTIGARIEEHGIRVLALDMRGRLPTLSAIWWLRRIVKQVQPDLVQGWMYHGNLAAWLAVRMAPGKTPMAWNIRHSAYDLQEEKLFTAQVIRAGAKLSTTPCRIIYNATVSARLHEKFGYDPGRAIVLPNGFDCEQFCPSIAARTGLKRELGVADGTMLIGMVASFRPEKDHANFLRAAGMLAAQRANVGFVLVGKGMDPGNGDLLEAIGREDLGKRVHLLGERHDIPFITAGLDIATSSSESEAFPNVVGEAMACGVPSVVTDVGDSSVIVGDTGVVVPPREPAALAAGWAKLLDLGQEQRLRLGAAARQRVLENYSLDSVARQYEAMYRAILGGR